MNYTVLFPNLLKKLPHIPNNAFCYNYASKANYNKVRDCTKVFIPRGKRQLLWFTQCSGKYYCVLLEMRCTKVVKCHFQYIPFDTILTCGVGTLIWVTSVGNELSLNRIIYNKGELCKMKLIEQHMNELKYIIENHINNIEHSSFMQLKLPAMSSEPNFIFTASNLKYETYCTVEMSSNFTHHLINFTANFMISDTDHQSDIYMLSYKDATDKLIPYQNAMITNEKTSYFVKDLLNIPYIHYKNIEYKDDLDTVSNVEERTKENMVSCVFSSSHSKWIPYKAIGHNGKINTLSEITKIREKSLASA